MKALHALTIMWILIALLGFGCALEQESTQGEGSHQGDDGMACTALAAASVTITVLDGDGVALSGVTVAYSVDGDEPLDADQLSDNEFVAGWEVAGDFVITATKQGYLSTVEAITVEMEESGCHVSGQVLEMVLVAKV